MKIAIPTFGARVSPRFDCAQAVLVVTVDDGGPSERQELAASGWAPHERINRLIELGVDTVICGGIDCWSVESLQAAGVTIYAWVQGQVEDALATLLRGDQDSQALLQAGGRWQWRRFPAHDPPRGPSADPVQGPTCAGRHRRGRRGQGRRNGPAR